MSIIGTHACTIVHTSRTDSTITVWPSGAMLKSPKRKKKKKKIRKKTCIKLFQQNCPKHAHSGVNFGPSTFKKRKVCKNVLQKVFNTRWDMVKFD